MLGFDSKNDYGWFQVGWQVIRLVKNIDAEFGSSFGIVGEGFDNKNTAGIKATVNSDDPAYFRAYMNDNFIELADEGQFSKDELAQLGRNAFDIAWISDELKTSYISQLNDYVAAAG